MCVCVTGYGFVDFDSPAAAQKAVTALKSSGVQAQMAKVAYMHILHNLSQDSISFNTVTRSYYFTSPKLKRNDQGLMTRTPMVPISLLTVFSHPLTLCLQLCLFLSVFPLHISLPSIHLSLPLHLCLCVLLTGPCCGPCHKVFVWPSAVKGTFVGPLS